MPSSLKNQGGQDHIPEPVSCEHWVKVLIGEIKALSMQKNESSNQPDEANDFQFKADRLRNLLEEGVRASHQKCAELTAIMLDR